MTKVLIVDDSPVVVNFLVYVLSQDPQIEVIGTAKNGEDAIEFLKHAKPDVISMDFHMPGMNGMETTARILEAYPIPIVIVSGTVQPQDIETSLECLKAGAIHVIPLPKGIGHPEFEASSREFCQILKLMAEVKVVRRRSQYSSKRPSYPIAAESNVKNLEVIAIGASTGGPIVIQTILSLLPTDFSKPILIVQHMASGFIQGFAEWLSHSTQWPVKVASQGEPLMAPNVYIAPNSVNMEVNREKRIVLKPPKSKNDFCPSVSSLFRSVAEVFGPRAVGILLTGMGADGAKELRMMKEKGAITIAQDEKSSVVFGMPGEAVKLNAALYQFSPREISEWIALNVSSSSPLQTDAVEFKPLKKQGSGGNER